MKWWRVISVFILALLPVSLAAEELDMDEYLYGHVLDSYEWHITTIKGHPVSIPLENMRASICSMIPNRTRSA